MIHKKTPGRWTSVRKETEEADGTSVRRKPAKARSFAKSGWNEEGISFYNKAVQFFNQARKDDRFTGMVEEARTMYWNEIRKQILSSRKRRHCDDSDNEEEVTTAPVMNWAGVLTDARDYSMTPV